MTPVRIAVASDLHFEFRGANFVDLTDLETTADILLAPGDIAIGTDAIDWCTTSPIPVIFVPGNHEFYNCDISKTRAALAKYAKQVPHVHLLDPGVAVFNIRERLVRVIGTTLWTDYELLGSERRLSAMEDAERAISDHRLIRFGDRRWRPDDAADEFEKSKRFLSAELAKPYDGLTVVATHHAPSGKVVAPRYQGDRSSPAFASDLDGLVTLADVWVYGHTHSNIETEIGGCRVISNQRGYRGENPSWKLSVYEF